MGEEASLQSSSGITSAAVGFGFGRSVKHELGVCRWQIPYATVCRCRCFALGALGDRLGIDGSLTNTIIEGCPAQRVEACLQSKQLESQSGTQRNMLYA